MALAILAMVAFHNSDAPVSHVPAERDRGLLAIFWAEQLSAGDRGLVHRHRHGRGGEHDEEREDERGGNGIYSKLLLRWPILIDSSGFYVVRGSRTRKDSSLSEVDDF